MAKDAEVKEDKRAEGMDSGETERREAKGLEERGVGEEEEEQTEVGTKEESGGEGKGDEDEDEED